MLTKKQYHCDEYLQYNKTIYHKIHMHSLFSPTFVLHTLKKNESMKHFTRLRAD
jgi:hypothetical protein